MLATTQNYYTLGELSRHFGRALGRNRLSRLMACGYLKSSFMNGKRVVHVDELRRFESLINSGKAVLMKDHDGSVLIEKVPAS